MHPAAAAAGTADAGAHVVQERVVAQSVALAENLKRHHDA